jgi:hypothetical protein
MTQSGSTAPECLQDSRSLRNGIENRFKPWIILATLSDMFEVIKTQLAGAGDKLAHLRRFL